MSSSGDLLDLVVLVADADTEATIRALLDTRTESLGIRALNYEIVRHPRRDPGVFREAPDFLRAYVTRALLLGDLGS